MHVVRRLQNLCILVDGHGYEVQQLWHESVIMSVESLILSLVKTYENTLAKALLAPRNLAYEAT